MLKKIEENPGPITNKAVKLSQELPYYWISEDENIILCGKIDWIEYLEETDSVHIIDFKTGKNEEDKDSLQLPIYNLLARNTQNRDVNKMSYWYLESSEIPEEQDMPDVKDSYEKVIEVARRVKLARQINRFKCPHGGCFACRPLEKVLRGEGERVNVSEYGQDIYVLNDN